MKINNVVVRNLGPIRELDLQLNGKNIVFAGTNGSGKTFLISSLVDFIYENLHMIGFNDVLPSAGTGYSYFRLTKPSYVSFGEQRGFIWIDGDINGEKLEYLESYGYDSPEEISAETGIPPENIPWPDIGYAKNVKRLDSSKRQEAKDYARNSSIFYIPASRYEEESWKNKVFFDKDFRIDNATRSTLGRSIEIKTSTRENYSWLVNEVLDFLVYKNPIIIARYVMLNELFGLILDEREPVAIHIDPDRSNRIVIDKSESKERMLNSLNDLSLGQSSMLYMFTNILRYGNQNIPPSEISGLVIIDEIDTHLHDNLKRSALPKLIRMFPKVQFIITTHDASCLVSFEETESIPNIISLPKGDKIYASEYEELKEARDHLFTATKESRELCERLGKMDKPILLVEDQYTELYKIAWMKLRDKNFNVENLEETFKTECPFCVVSASGCAKIQALLQRDYLAKDLRDKKLVALFDFDDAYTNFDKLPSELWGEISGEDSTGLVRQCEKYPNLYAMLLPVPACRANMASRKFKNRSLLEIELLFSNETLGDDCGINSNIPGGFCHFKGNKGTFWRKAINYEKEKFNNFERLFDKVEELFNQE